MSEITVSIRLLRQEAEAPTERIPRAARVLALAHKWRGLIRSGAVKDQAELARLVGVSRARVTQVMGLLWLAPDVQEAVLFGEIDTDERGLRDRAHDPIWICEPAATALDHSRRGRPTSGVRYGHPSK